MTVRIRRKLESDTLYLPELRVLIGKNVEIIVREDAPAPTTLGTGDWNGAMKAVDELEGYELNVWQKQRDYDLQHAKDHLL